MEKLNLTQQMHTFNYKKTTKFSNPHISPKRKLIPTGTKNPFLSGSQGL